MELLVIMFLPAIISVIVGIALLVSKKKKAGLIFIILGIIYVIISVGICATLIMSY